MMQTKYFMIAIMYNLCFNCCRVRVRYDIFTRTNFGAMFTIEKNENGIKKGCTPSFKGDPDKQLNDVIDQAD